jgi:alkanesulfonate monooxygenase SsuD/methylene tetrahydromethanopterin reductase-like flavin-dependent oxidoreductase (luciferase family)
MSGPVRREGGHGDADQPPRAVGLSPIGPEPDPEPLLTTEFPVPDPSTPFHLAVALDGAGWHPAAWREPDARPDELLTPGYWTDLVQEAERGLIDFVTIEDAFTLQSDDHFAPDERTDRVRGRIDAVLTAARVAPTTRHIGFIPTAVVNHTEPFHLSKAIATLDYVSNGRAGVRVQGSPRHDSAEHVGRRSQPRLSLASLADPAIQQLIVDNLDEAGDYVEVLRRLWDSWEDDAEIRDAATGRFVDRDKLHYIDVEGRWFSVKGPSITPRPPQGQPVVAALGHSSVPYQLIARSADVGFITPVDAAQAADIVGEIGALQLAAGREGDTVHVFGDLVVVLADTEQAARARLERLDARAGAPYTSDAKIFAGTPAQLADLLAEWHGAGLSGFRLRPAALPHDLQQITRGLVPELQRRGLFRTAYPVVAGGAGSLRDLLGLPRPASRYAAL